VIGTLAAAGLRDRLPAAAVRLTPTVYRRLIVGFGCCGGSRASAPARGATVLVGGSDAQGDVDWDAPPPVPQAET
jgi:hypothetical protein